MRFPKLNGGFFSGNLLRITFLTGVILFALTGIIFALFYFIGGGSETAQEESFFRILREYDKSAGAFAGTDREIERLNKELDRLEKKAIGVESWLSVLKRRRALALQGVQLHPPSMETYRQSIRRAVKAYPWSQPLAAVAAAAIVRDTAINKEAEEELRSCLSLITDPSFNTLRLGLFVLAGDFRSPEKAAQLPRELFSDGTGAVTIDLAVLKILREDFRGAAADIQTALNSEFPSDDFVRLAAEYHYDFGDISRSAELFSRLEDEAALIRQADALWLAGFTGSARSIWSILADASTDGPNENSLYNLAVTSETQDEAASSLEKLVKIIPASNTDSRQFGLIRYSRLLPNSQAIAALENAEKIKPSEYPFIDLEIRKRRAHEWQPNRQLAETWLLLDRHFENEDLYHWAVWFFFYQRFYGETGTLFKRAGQYPLSGQWVPAYEAIALMQEGDLQTAENILRAIPAATAEWHVFANLGRILESERSPSRALEQYELAAAKTQNPKTASRLQLRIARCLATLGRASEGRRALEYALDLDPGNLTAQLELDRMLIP